MICCTLCCASMYFVCGECFFTVFSSHAPSRSASCWNLILSRSIYMKTSQNIHTFALLYFNYVLLHILPDNFIANEICFVRSKIYNEGFPQCDLVFSQTTIIFVDLLINFFNFPKPSSLKGK